jgi:hypothetical protein
MSLIDLKDRLDRLETDKLLDISKNYRQYGYDNQTRNYVLGLLKDRGMPVEDLWLTGNFENKTYELAVHLFEVFKRNSTIALFFYMVVLVFKLSIIVHFSGWESYPIILLILYYSSLAGYLVFLIMSFLNQSDLYKMTGDNYGTEGVIAYLLGGVAFYCITYFYFLKQMKEKMKLIK